MFLNALLNLNEPSPKPPTSFKISASLFSRTYLSQNSSYLSSVSITIQENLFFKVMTDYIAVLEARAVMENVEL